MRRIDGVIGNRHDDPDLEKRIAEHERAGTLERVLIESGERKKSRLRVETDSGTDLGIVVGDDELRSGDVLFVDEAGAAVVVFETREALVVELPPADESTTASAVEFGHRVGNQHWDIAVEGGAVYVPLDVERRIIEDVLGPYVPEGARTRYEEVDAELFLDDDGGGEHASGGGSDHSHADGSDHSHTHGDGSDHSHDHEDGDQHSHDHDHEDGDQHSHDHDHEDGGHEYTHE